MAQGRINTKIAKAAQTHAAATATPDPTGPGADQRYRILGICASYSTLTAVGALQIIRGNGSTVIWEEDINRVDHNWTAVNGIQVPRVEGDTTPGGFTVVLADGGSGIAGKVNVIYGIEF